MIPNTSRLLNTHTAEGDWRREIRRRSSSRKRRRKKRKENESLTILPQ
jgi:hypothetical protein